MKYKIFLLILVAILCFLSLAKTLHAEKIPLTKLTYCLEPNYVPPPKPDVLDVYLDKLALCESGNNPKAINPVDLDGTPSLGRYQFKVGTFNYFSERYGIATTSIWNGDEQRTIVRKMAENLSPKEWVNQFPDCTRRFVGYPPKVGG